MSDIFLDDTTDDEFEVLNEVDGLQICKLKPKPSNLQWHKRVTSDMAAEYTALGWTVVEREGRTVLLVWNKPGVPT